MLRINFYNQLEDKEDRNWFSDGSIHFPMDTILGDKLVGGVDGTVYGSPLIMPGVLGNALFFDPRRNDSVDLGIYP